jgi:hypothetical protein
MPVNPPLSRRLSSRFGAVATTITTVVALVVGGSIVVPAHAAPAPGVDYAPTPDVGCGPGDLPEAIQGRVPLADYASGRAAKGYTCNAEQVSHFGTPTTTAASAGGYRVYRYVDTAGHVCAFYDTTLLFPANAYAAGTRGTGVWVLDMTDPAHPVHTATLATPAMQSPHESFSINVKRGLLGAVMGNPLFDPGQFDLYDASADCRHPVIKASLAVGVLGHEGSFAPDGKTYYAASLFGHTLTAIDVSVPTAPTVLWNSLRWNVHGLNVSDDGNTVYFADVGRNGLDSFPAAGTATSGLTVLDTSQIQARVLNPQVNVVSHLTWSRVSTPQTDIPVTIRNHRYLVEVDEFASGDDVGAARIIDIADIKKPRVVSNMRLAVNNPDHRNDGSQSKDPNATNGLQGYAGHYCSVPSEVDPTMVACSFILSGLRLFDIRDPFHPREIAYFNRPATQAAPGQGPGGAYAMSQPAFDMARHSLWYSDGNTGFYVVHVRNNVWR